MQSAEELVPIGERLVIISREFTDDVNETYLLAHKALRRLLRQHAVLSEAKPADFQRAVSSAAEALGLYTAGKGERESSLGAVMRPLEVSGAGARRG